MDPLRLMYKQFAVDWNLLSEVRANSKGASYEQRLAVFLSKYFGGVYDVRQRAAIIDPNLDCIDAFDYSGDEELDVVGVFRRSAPQFIFEYTPRHSHIHHIESNPSIKLVPGEAVAFVCEVKSRLNKGALEDDLEKISKIAELDEALQGRFDSYFSTEMTINNPMRCLIYNKNEIAEDTLKNKLLENDDWHLLLTVMDDSLIINNNLPLYDYFDPLSDNFGPTELSLPKNIAEYLCPEAVNSEYLKINRGIFWFFIAISISVPKPIQVSAIDSVLSLSGPPDISYYG